MMLGYKVEEVEGVGIANPPLIPVVVLPEEATQGQAIKLAKKYEQAGFLVKIRLGKFEITTNPEIT